MGDLRRDRAGPGLPGDGITPIYVVTHPAFEADPVEEQLRQWIKDLQAPAVHRVAALLARGARRSSGRTCGGSWPSLPGQIAERLKRAPVRDMSPNTVPLPSVHFVGRRDEMHSLLKDLIQRQIGAITAVHGIPGIGKSMLAFAYAWGYGYKYPGGRFLIQAAQPDRPGRRRDRAGRAQGGRAQGRGAEEPRDRPGQGQGGLRGRPAGLDRDRQRRRPQLLTPQARERALPRAITSTCWSPPGSRPMTCPASAACRWTRCRPMTRWPCCRASARSPTRPRTTSGRPRSRSSAGGWAATPWLSRSSAVFLRENPDVSYREFAESLERDGITLLEDEVGPEARGGTALARRELHRPAARADPGPARPRSCGPSNTPRSCRLTTCRFPGCAICCWPTSPSSTGRASSIRSATILKRLERLRLVVPQAQRSRYATAAAAWRRIGWPGCIAWCRTWSAARLDQNSAIARERAVNRHADARGDWLKGHWGQPGLAWELSPLCDLALRRIERGTVAAVCWRTRSRHRYCIPVACSTSASSGASAAMFQRLAGAAPENADYARDLSVSYNKLGDLARVRRRSSSRAAVLRGRAGDRQAAVRPGPRERRLRPRPVGQLQQARRPGEGPVAIRRRRGGTTRTDSRSRTGWPTLAPANADYARDLSISYERLGDLAMSGGDPAAARRYYEDGLAIAKRLSDAAPDNADLRSATCRSATSGWATWRCPVAIPRRRGGITRTGSRSQSGWPERPPTTPTTPATCRSATTSSVTWRSPAAIRPRRGGTTRTALTIAKRLSDAAPENADYARDLSVSFNKLGDLAMSGGDPAAARRYYEDWSEDRETAGRRGPENADYARDLSVSYDRLGDLALSGGDPGDSAAVLRGRARDRDAAGRRWPPTTPTTPATCGSRAGEWPVSRSRASTGMEP